MSATSSRPVPMGPVRRDPSWPGSFHVELLGDLRAHRRRSDRSGYEHIRKTVDKRPGPARKAAPAPGDLTAPVRRAQLGAAIEDDDRLLVHIVHVVRHAWPPGRLNHGAQASTPATAPTRRPRASASSACRHPSNTSSSRRPMMIPIFASVARWRRPPVRSGSTWSGSGLQPSHDARGAARGLNTAPSAWYSVPARTMVRIGLRGRRHPRAPRPPR